MSSFSHVRYYVFIAFFLVLNGNYPQSFGAAFAEKADCSEREIRFCFWQGVKTDSGMSFMGLGLIKSGYGIPRNAPA